MTFKEGRSRHCSIRCAASSSLGRPHCRSFSSALFASDKARAELKSSAKSCKALHLRKIGPEGALYSSVIFMAHGFLGTVTLCCETLGDM